MRVMCENRVSWAGSEAAARPRKLSEKTENWVVQRSWAGGPWLDELSYPAEQEADAKDAVRVMNTGAARGFARYQLVRRTAEADELVADA